MANRNFNRFQALEKEVKAIYAIVTIAGSGAPTLVAADSKGVASITRNSAGQYTLVLQDQYNKLMQAQVSIQSATAQDLHAQQVSETVASSTKNVVFRTLAVGVATDPSSGSVLRIRLDLKNSSVR